MKLLYWVAGFIIVAAILAFTLGNPDAKKTDTNPQASPSPTSTASASSSPKSPKFLHKMNEDVKVGNYVFKVTNAIEGKTLDTGFSEVKTDGKFLLLTVKITNNDKAARDISSNVFKLYDQEGREFLAYKDTSVDTEKYLYYETINPGLSRTRTIVFETPEDAGGFQLFASSGVLFTDGETEGIEIKDIAK